MDIEEYLTRVRQLVIENKQHWREMDREHVASHTYLRRFAAGDFDNPGILTLASIEAYLESA